MLLDGHAGAGAATGSAIRGLAIRPPGQAGGELRPACMIGIRVAMPVRRVARPFGGGRDE